MSQIRRILKAHISEDDVREFFAKPSWEFVSEREAADERHPRQVSWRNVKSGTQVDYVEDPITEARFLWIRGEDLDGLDLALQVHLKPWTRDEILAFNKAAGTPDDEARGLFLAALHASPDEFDEAIFSQFKDRLANPDAYVRYQTIGAISSLPWPQFRPLLESVQHDDPNEQVRDLAARLVELFQAK